MTGLDWNKMSPRDRLLAIRFTTPAYQTEALRLIMEEASHVARDMALPETLPITRSNLLSAYITPPRLAEGMKAVGNITTSNYTYFVSIGNKFSFLVRTRLEAEEAEAHAKFLSPIRELDTNAAFQLATRFMTSAGMNMTALNTNCHISIQASLPEGTNSQHFVPLYWVNWIENGTDQKGGASVQLCLPTQTLLQMHVNKPEYILRPALVFTNLEELLSQTNPPASSP